MNREVKLLMSRLVASEARVDNGGDPASIEGHHYSLGMVVLVHLCPFSLAGKMVFFLKDILYFAGNQSKDQTSLSTVSIGEFHFQLTSINPSSSSRELGASRETSALFIGLSSASHADA